ncbi:hypothetical protein DCE79_10545 [Lysinibacillus sp. 2017]|uniref:hypothetical protein n=1 Tax=unclassified Lysinibacillus TaxID=2636778 RepID=UPI000D528AF1|nr:MULTISPECIES: hypothetical protein [unclassified Lysinibacillus]AWE07795.1 hypothetical protein DCE79_10545 [Lysinibacillus sp. 2017]TGN34616.1 hypothetical protein E4L99_13900 [Lysinibacillus sp. S2017]
MKNNIALIEDRKSFLIAIVLLVLFYLFLSNYWHYPSPPIDSVTSKEVVNILESSDSEFIKITTEENYDWYLGKGLFTFDVNVFTPLSEAGWEKQGSIPHYNSNGKLISYDQIFTQSQSDDKPTITLELKIYPWKDSVQFLKIPKDVKY